MNIALFGATGRLGSRVLAEALSRGHGVSVLARDPSKIAAHPRLTVAQGDVLDPDAVARALAGADAAVSSLGGGVRGPFAAITQGTANIVAAMLRGGPRRLVAVGGAGVLRADAEAQTLRRDHPQFPPMLRAVSGAHLEALRSLEGSGLDWTLFGPPNMPSGARTGTYRLVPDFFPEGGREVSLEDMAKAIVDEVERPQFVGRRVGIAY